MMASELQRRNSEPIKSGLLDKGLRTIYRDGRPGSLEDLSRSLSQNYVTCQEIMASTNKQREKLALSPDEGYGTDKTTSASPQGYGNDNRSSTTTVSSPTYSSLYSLNSMGGHPRGPMPSVQTPVLRSPTVMHRGTSFQASSRSSVNKHGGLPVKRRDAQMEILDASLEDRLRALTTIEEEESGFVFSEKKHTAESFARNGSLRLPKEFTPSQKLEHCNKIHFSERSNYEELPDGYFRAEPIAVDPDLQRHDDGFSQGNGRDVMNDGRNFPLLQRGTSPRVQGDGWKDYTRYFQKDNEIPLHNIDPAGRPKFTNASVDDMPDMDINRQIGTGSPARHRNNSMLSLILDDDAVGSSEVNHVDKGKYPSFGDGSCNNVGGRDVEHQMNGQAFQQLSGGQPSCGQTNGQPRGIQDIGQQMGSQYYGPLNGVQDIGQMRGGQDIAQLRAGQGISQLRSVHDFRQLRDGQDFGQSRVGQDLGQLRGDQDFRQLGGSQNFRQLRDGNDFEKLRGGHDFGQLKDGQDFGQLRGSLNYGQLIGGQDSRHSRVTPQSTESVAMGFHQNSKQHFVMSSMPDLTSRHLAWGQHHGHQSPHHVPQPRQSAHQHQQQRQVLQQSPQLYQQQGNSHTQVESQQQNLPPQSNRYLNQHALYGSSMDVYDLGHSAYYGGGDDDEDVFLRQSRPADSASYPNRYSWQSGSLHDSRQLVEGDRSKPTSTERSTLDLGNIPQLQRQIRATSELCLQASRRHMFASSADIYKLFSGQKKPPVRTSQSVAHESSEVCVESKVLFSLPSGNWSENSSAKSESLQESPRMKPKLRVVMPPSSLTTFPSPGPVRADHTINVPAAAWESVSSLPNTATSDNERLSFHRSSQVMSAHTDSERYNFQRPVSASTDIGRPVFQRPVSAYADIDKPLFQRQVSGFTDIEKPMFQRQSSGYSSETELQQIEFNAKAVKKLQQHQQQQYLQGASQEFLPLNRSLDRECNTDHTDEEPVYVNQLALNKDRIMDSKNQPFSGAWFPPTERCPSNCNNHETNHEKIWTSNWSPQHPNTMAAPKINTQVTPSVNTDTMGFSQSGITQKQVINFSSRPVTITSHIPPSYTPPLQASSTHVPYNHSSSGHSSSSQIPPNFTLSSHNHISSSHTPSSHSSSSHSSSSQMPSNYTSPSQISTSNIPSSQTSTSNISSSHIPTNNTMYSHIISNNTLYNQIPKSLTSSSHASSKHTSTSHLPTSRISSSHIPSSHIPSSHIPSSNIPSSTTSSGHIPSSPYRFQESNNAITPATQNTNFSTNTTSSKAQYSDSISDYPTQPTSNKSLPVQFSNTNNDNNCLSSKHRPGSSSSVQLSPVQIAQILDTPFETNIISDEQGDRLSTLV